MKTQKMREKEMAEAEEKRMEKAKKDMEAAKKRGVFSDGIADLGKVDKVSVYWDILFGLVKPMTRNPANHNT